MADLETTVIQAWAAGDPVTDGGAPLRLLQRQADGTLQEIAHHDAGVDPSPTLHHAGSDHSLTQLLDTNLLRQDDLMAIVGSALFDRLSLGDVGTELARLGRGHRVFLDLRSPDLEKLPWELLRRGLHRLFQIESHPWLLGSPEPPPPDPLALGQVPLGGPLRILLVIGNDPEDDAVQGDDELRLLEDCLHSCREVLLEVLERPRPELIQQTLNRFEPQVLHFIGHGATRAGKSVLRIYSGPGASESWDAERIRLVLGNVRAPRLVVLNACQSAATGPEVWSLTDAFLGSGVGALVAMQADILGEAALRFAKSLYLSLRDGLTVDIAMVRARQAVALDGSGAARASWPIPRLRVQGNPETVVRLGIVEPGECPANAPDDFVHRWPERHRACQVLFPETDDGPRLVILEGPADSGKTELLKILGETWSHAGGDTLFVDLGGTQTSSLRVVIQRTHQLALNAGFDASGFDALDLDQPDTKTLAGAFLRALESLTQEPLLLLFDGFEPWQLDRVRDLAIEELWKPFAAPDPRSRVRLATTLPRDHSRRLSASDLPIQPIQVSDFTADEWRRAAALFLRFHSRDREAEFTWLWGPARLIPPDELVEPDRESYSPSILGHLRGLRASLG